MTATARRRAPMAIPEADLLEARRLTAIRTADAFTAIRRCAEALVNGKHILEVEDLQLAAAAEFFDCIGTWSFCADALAVRSLDRAVASGSKLDRHDYDRLIAIHARAMAQLTRGQATREDRR